MRPILLALLGLAASLTPLRAAQAEAPLVFAAASLKTALDEIAADYAATGHEAPVLSYAGSSALAQQIAAGAPADLFISAAQDWMDVAEAAGAVVPGSRRDLLGNRLVLISAAPGQLALADLPAALGEDKLAMALVEAVPAGQYGKAALSHLGLWDALAPQVAQADNVRAALALVATGEAPFGVVYATDAAAEARVHIAATFPADSHPDITYPVALLTGGPALTEAQGFLEYLASPDAAAVFAAQGFAVK